MLRIQALAIAASLAIFSGSLAAPTASAGYRDASRQESARVTEHLLRLGFSSIVDVDVKVGRFVVDAVNPAGREVDVELDLQTLRIIRETGS